MFLGVGGVFVFLKLVFIVLDDACTRGNERTVKFKLDCKARVRDTKLKVGCRCGVAGPLHVRPSFGCFFRGSGMDVLSLGIGFRCLYPMTRDIGLCPLFNLAVSG